MAQPSPQIALDSTIHCPACGSEHTLRMPEDYCQIVYTCPACGTILHPKAGDCCVFCSYGSVPCPSIQIERQAGG